MTSPRSTACDERHDVGGDGGRAGQAERADADGAGRDFQRRVEAAAARVVGDARDARLALGVRLDLDGARIAFEGDGDVLRRRRDCSAPTERARRRPRHRRRGISRLARVTTTSFRPSVSRPTSACGRTASITRLGRHRAGAAEVGRAEDRHVGDDAGIVDQVADAHDFAGDDGVGLERRRAAGRLARRRRSARPGDSSDGADRCGSWRSLSASGWRSPTASGRRR